MPASPILSIQNLQTHFFTRGGVIKAVDGVSLELQQGETLGVVGESGSGKSVTCLSVLGLVPPPGKIVGGAVLLDGRNLVGLSSRELRQVRMALSSGVIAYFTLVFLFIFAMPEVERYRGEQPFAQAVRAKLQGDLSTLAMFRIWGPGLVFYLSPDKPIPEFKDPADLTNFVRDNQVRWLIVRERDLSSLPLTGSAVVRETIFPWEKSSRTRNKYLLLDLKPGPIARN